MKLLFEDTIEHFDRLIKITKQTIPGADLSEEEDFLALLRLEFSMSPDLYCLGCKHVLKEKSYLALLSSIKATVEYAIPWTPTRME
jgi:hypothetical protein